MDLQPHRPVAVSGLVRLGGRPAPHGARLQLGHEVVTLDEEGRFRAAFAPGTYACSLQVGHLPTTTFDASRDLTVAPGVCQDVALDFAHRRVTLRVRSADGSAVASKWVRLHAVAGDGTAGRLEDTRVLDETGTAEIEDAWDEPRLVLLWSEPPPVRVHDVPASPPIELGLVALPAGRDSATFDFAVRSPAK